MIHREERRRKLRQGNKGKEQCGRRSKRQMANGGVELMKQIGTREGRQPGRISPSGKEEAAKLKAAEGRNTH
jgi:hypothetical protein